MKAKAVQGKQVPVEWTETSVGVLEWWHDPAVPLPFPLESASLEMRWECREFFPDQSGKGSLISSYEPEKELLWMWPGHSCFLLSGDGYVGELLEFQHDCERLFGSSRGHV